MIHPTAIVEADVDASCNIWAFAHVLSGALVGKRVNIGDHAYIESGAKIGDNVTIKNSVCIWQGITIEDDVFIGPNVTFTNDCYPRSPRMPAVADRYADTDRWLLRTHIRRGCSVGAGAVICPGLEIGEYSMIAAGSVVTRDVDSHALVAGVPARPIGKVCRCGQRMLTSRDVTECVTCSQASSLRDPEPTKRG